MVGATTQKGQTMDADEVTVTINGEDVEYLVIPKSAACHSCGMPLSQWDGKLYVDTLPKKSDES